MYFIFTNTCYKVYQRCLTHNMSILYEEYNKTQYYTLHYMTTILYTSHIYNTMNLIQCLVFDKYIETSILYFSLYYILF
jgi:hypothetical protein